ncbi:MAG: hypothetical protein LBS93_02410 [Synergistaceae bacterium]|nr:hypothetical protein [Synergistaceae bacterium]
MTDSKKLFPMYILILLALASAIELVAAARLMAWSAAGFVPETEIEYSDLQVTRDGVSVKLTNGSQIDVKVSLSVTFYDDSGNKVGHTIFGLRKISAGSVAEISRNYLTGNWRGCRDAPRAEWRKMTYEYLY